MPSKTLAFTLFSVFCSSPLFSQSNQAPASGLTSTIRTSAHLVILDVVVEDAEHNPVRGLKPSDFQVLENGAAQHPRSFEEHFPPDSAGSAKLPLIPKLPPGMFTNYTPVPANSAINIILIDALNTPQIDQIFLHDQLLGFLRAQPPGYPTAIFGLSGSLVLLQGVTTDPKVLEAVLARKNLPKKSPVLDNSLRGNGDSNLTEVAVANASDGSTTGERISQVLANLQAFERITEIQRNESRASMTLDALNSIARYLYAIPGRKNLIWFSGAFPVNPVPSVASLRDVTSSPSPSSSLPSGSVNSSSAFSNFAGNEAEFRETTNLLTRSQVAVYPIDARGLINFAGMDSTNSGGQYARSTSARPGAAGSPGVAGSDLDDFAAQTAAEHEVMSVMARDTGGEAFYNANSLGKFAGQAMRDGSSYYTFAYTPTDAKWNGDFRKITVQVEGKPYALSYRRGYYADAPDALNPRHEAAAVATIHWSPVATAMLRGAPAPTQILISARVHPASTSTENLLAPDNFLVQPDRLHTEGPFRRYVVECIADPARIQADQLPNGHRSIHVDFLTFVYDPSGKIINRVATTVTADLTPENYALIQKRGLAIRQQVSVPARGEHFLRVGVHDLPSNRVGALEISTADVSGLAALQPQTAAK